MKTNDTAIINEFANFEDYKNYLIQICMKYFSYINIISTPTMIAIICDIGRNYLAISTTKNRFHTSAFNILITMHEMPFVCKNIYKANEDFDFFIENDIYKRIIFPNYSIHELEHFLISHTS